MKLRFSSCEARCTPKPLWNGFGLINRAKSNMAWLTYGRDTMKKKRKAKQEVSFHLGRVCCTPGCMKQIPVEDLLRGLWRHAEGEWGNVSENVGQANDRALQTSGLLLSRYRSQSGVVFWIITEADRSATMVCLPDEYQRKEVKTSTNRSQNGHKRASRG